MLTTSVFLPNVNSARYLPALRLLLPEEEDHRRIYPDAVLSPDLDLPLMQTHDIGPALRHVSEFLSRGQSPPVSQHEAVQRTRVKASKSSAAPTGVTHVTPSRFDR